MTQKQKENIKHERVLKLKKIGFWTLNIVSYILAALFLIVLIISLATPKKQNVSPRSAYRLYENQITEVIREDSPNNVIYDDNSSEIDLSNTSVIYDDTNYTIQITNLPDNYALSNLFPYTYSNNSLKDKISIIYENATYTFNNESSQMGAYMYGEYKVMFPYAYNTFQQAFGANILTQDSVATTYNGETLIWVNDFSIITTSAYYDDLKALVQLDIPSNESSETDSIFESLSNVLTNFITTLNSGVTSVIALFWDSTNLQLTLLGNLTTIVIGAAVCFFLFRLVIGLIRLRG